MAWPGFQAQAAQAGFQDAAARYALEAELAVLPAEALAECCSPAGLDGPVERELQDEAVASAELPSCYLPVARVWTLRQAECWAARLALKRPADW